MILYNKRTLGLVLLAGCVAVFLLRSVATASGSASTEVPSSFPKYSPGSDVCRGDPIVAEMDTLRMSASDASSAIESECNAMTPEIIRGCTVPNVLHLVLGFPGKFDFYAYLSVKSAHDRMKPEAIYMHVFGQRFDLSPYLQRAIDEFGVKLVASRDVRQVHDRPVDVVEHRSDVVRLETLIRFGGVYIDLDAFVLQPLDVYYNNELTMPAESDVGVNNGVMIAKRCSRFLRKWYGEYTNFDDSKWGDHSILLPKKLAAQNPDLITVEQDTLQSDYTDTYERLMSDKLDPVYWNPVRIVHSFIRLAEKKYDEESIKQVNTNFGTMARRIMEGKPGMIDP
jgi:hypothetical protein